MQNEYTVLTDVIDKFDYYDIPENHHNSPYLLTADEIINILLYI